MRYVKKEEGEEIEKCINGVVYKYIKVKGKWRSNGRKDGLYMRGNSGRKKGPEKPKKVPKLRVKKVRVVKVKMPKVKVVKLKPVKPAKEPEKKYKTIIRNIDLYKTIKVNANTYIQVLKSTDDQQAINQWYQKIERQEKLKYVPSNNRKI